MTMSLRPSARLQRFLGKELISDPNLAILEFVKNAYDAGASDVLIRFSHSTYPTSVIIADNGTGMDEASFRFHWLRPGFSSKASEYRGDGPSDEAASAAHKLRESRSPAGEKGLGRLAAGRLGDTLVVWTRIKSDDLWLRVEFDWSRFDNMYLAMDEVTVPFSYEPDAPAGSFETGTVIEVMNLNQSWYGAVMGRPVQGRPRTKLGRLKQDLSFLLRHASGETGNFRIQLDSDSFSNTADIGVIDSELSQHATSHYRYEFNVVDLVPNGGAGPGLTVERKIFRSAEVVQATGRDPVEVLDQGTPRGRIDLPSDSWTGPFSGVFLYTPPPAAKRAQELDFAPTGVLLYRDDILVEPYGLHGNDWLGVEAHKASRQGHAAIQPHTFSGMVQISRSSNPLLIDMANRLGLLDTDASAAFFRILREEVRRFEDILYQEVLVEQRWLGKKELKAAEKATEAERIARIRLQALAHRAGQPIQAIGFDVLSLRRQAADQRLPEDVRTALYEASSRIESNLERLSGIVDSLSSDRSSSIEYFAIANVIQDVREELCQVADNCGVSILIPEETNIQVLAPQSLVFESLTEIVTNAIEVPRPDSRQNQAQVVVAVVKEHDDFIVVRVSDNGIGFPPDVIPTSGWDVIESTKGRPARGLSTTASAVVASRGSMVVENSGNDGTTIAIRLPLTERPVLS